MAVFAVFVFFEVVNAKAVTTKVIGTEKPNFKSGARKIESQTLFVKIPQEHKNLPTKEILPESIFPRDLDLGTGCTNQIAKILIPVKASNELSQPDSWDGTSFIKIPTIRQPFDDYKIIVAQAPNNLKIGNEPVVVYIVFSEDDDSVQNFKIPEIYFVAKNRLLRNKVDDPFLIIDNNRTVSGYKSNKVTRIIRFKNKFADLFGYR